MRILLIILIGLFSSANAQEFSAAVRQAAAKVIVRVVPADAKFNANSNKQSGSGTVISKNGLILTNYHVVSDRDGVAFANQQIFVSPQLERLPVYTYRALLVAFDEDLDLALLQIKALASGQLPAKGFNLPFAQIADSNTVLPLDPLLVVGYPEIAGATQTFLRGSMGGWAGEKRESGEGKYWIKTEAPITKGNSGGGVFNTKGQLIAVPTRFDQRSDGVQRWLRPINLARALILEQNPSLVANIKAPSLKFSVGAIYHGLQTLQGTLISASYLAPNGQPYPRNRVAINLAARLPRQNKAIAFGQAFENTSNLLLPLEPPSLGEYIMTGTVDGFSLRQKLQVSTTTKSLLAVPNQIRAGLTSDAKNISVTWAAVPNAKSYTVALLNQKLEIVVVKVSQKNNLSFAVNANLKERYVVQVYALEQDISKPVITLPDPKARVGASMAFSTPFTAGTISPSPIAVRPSLALAPVNGINASVLVLSAKQSSATNPNPDLLILVTSHPTWGRSAVAGWYEDSTAWQWVSSQVKSGVYKIAGWINGAATEIEFTFGQDTTSQLAPVEKLEVGVSDTLLSSTWVNPQASQQTWLRLLDAETKEVIAQQHSQSNHAQIVLPAPLEPDRLYLLEVISLDMADIIPIASSLFIRPDAAYAVFEIRL